jgi:hypothetical protein
MLEWLGWLATAIFTLSYCCRRPAVLRRTQALAAVLWIGYGVIIEAPPVIAANLLVAAMALLSSFQCKAPNKTEPMPGEGPARPARN